MITWKEKLRNPFVQQYLIEILFPLIGFFFFDWSLTIIAVFYLVDQMASEILFIRRLHKISRTENKKNNKYVLLAILIFLVLFLTQLFFLQNAFLDIREIQSSQLNLEVWNFAKEELWLLFPVVLLVYHFKDQFTFYMTRRYLLYKVKRTFIYHQLLNLMSIGGILLGVISWSQSKISDVLVLIIFLISKIVFDFTIAKWADKKSKK